MASSRNDTHLEPGDSISVADRLIGAGCVLAFARDTQVYLLAEHEDVLRTILNERAASRLKPRLRLVDPALPLGFDIGITRGSLHGRS